LTRLIHLCYHVGMSRATLENKQHAMRARYSGHSGVEVIPEPMPEYRIRQERPCLGCGKTITKTFPTSKQCCSKECWNKYRKDKQIYLSYAHGMTQEQYAGLSASQSDVCAICGQPEPEHSRFSRLSVDHHHPCPNKHNQSTQSCPTCRRGLLCSPCNKDLGHVEDLLNFIIEKSIDCNSLPDYRKIQIEYLKKWLLK
jgi:predicted nucleic acid-binding Zn ribbon protein